MERHVIRITALTLALIFFLGACAGGKQRVTGEDLTAGINARPEASEAAVSLEGTIAVTDFSVRLLQASFFEQENVLVSPVSVLFSLGMTANGAEGETLSQMEQVFGLTVPELNRYLRAYRDALPDDETSKAYLANAIWLRDDPGLTVYPEFLQENADWYQAGIYRADFDAETASDINRFISKHTQGMIPEIVEEMSPEAVMYLVNALYFEGEWAATYQDWAVSDGIFTTEVGAEQRVSLMHSTEYDYLSDERAQGFIKYFRNSHYAFAAILPNEDISLSEYLASLDGKDLQRMLFMHSTCTVETSTPQMEVAYASELSRTLEDMGMTDAFDVQSADFSALGKSADGNLYLKKVLHKTFLTLGPKGARAGAATVVEAAAGAAPAQEVKEVYLTRPFLYLIMDTETNVPLFIGTAQNMDA